MKKWYLGLEEKTKKNLKMYFLCFGIILSVYCCISGKSFFSGKYSIVGFVICVSVAVLSFIIAIVLFCWDRQTKDQKTTRQVSQQIDISSESTKKDLVEHSEEVVSESIEIKANKKDEIEKARKEKSLGRLVDILEKFNNLANNEDLIKIVDNFLLKNRIMDIEILAAPVKVNYYGNVNPSYKLCDIENTEEHNFDSIRHTLTTSYNEWKKDPNLFTVVYNSESDDTKAINYLYTALLQQERLISNDKDAFYILVSERLRESRIEQFKFMSTEYGMGLDEDVSVVISKMYSMGLDKERIEYYISLKLFEREKDKSFYDCCEKSGVIVDDFVEKIKSKNYIEKLLIGETVEKITIEEIDLMSGFEFETFVADSFNKMGYEAKVTKSSGDQGIDVIAKKNGFVVAIQAKCYSGVVGNRAIMEAVAGMKYYKANKCMVITNSTFTKSARELAKANDVELWDRQILKEKLQDI